MLKLINGKPKFYIGKINGAGYTSKEEKEKLVVRLKEEDKDVEIIDEKVEIDEELKEKAEHLAKLELTFSKAEFMDYLSGEKPLIYLELQELQEAVDILLGEVGDE